MELQEFSFGNFRSFKDINTLNLSAANITDKNNSVYQDNTIDGQNVEKVSFLKTKVIYGANASGKSNVVKAFFVFSKVIKESLKDGEILSNFVDSFAFAEDVVDEPTFFQIMFWDKGVKYRYGFEVTRDKISAEWLFGKKGQREQCYFTREGLKITELDKTNFQEGQLAIDNLSDKQGGIFRDNALFLSTLSAFGFAHLSAHLMQSFAKIAPIDAGFENKKLYQRTREFLFDKRKKASILNLLRYGDIGIEDLVNHEYGNNNEKRNVLLASRKVFDKNNQHTGKFKWLPFKFFESGGTQKLFELSPLIYSVLNNQGVLVIDEFDARFHPLLSKKIIQLFNSKANKGAQLVVVSHDTNLLSHELLRRDQIAFVEKDKYGASHLYDLVRFKGVRNNAPFEKDYIQGKYGAIPFLGDFTKLIKKENV